ncbi:MAG: hypothetical protein ACREGG_02845 [Candidatus Saccharimonadales bacterium]
MASTKIGLKTTLLAMLSFLGLLLVPVVVKADGTVTSFSSAQTLQPGIIVALDKNSDKTVTTAPANDTTKIYGVVVDPSDAPFTLNNQGQTFVATSGIYQVLVSTSNGAIKAGDYISMSPNNGIGAKADNLQAQVLGQAETSFDGKSNVITNSGSAAIGRVYVNINIQNNPIAGDTAVPVFLKKIANSLANKPVSVVRIYVALVFFLIASVSAVTILWSGIRGSLISLGRNPLSRHTIFSGMYKVIFTGVGIFILGLAGVYLLLKV